MGQPQLKEKPEVKADDGRSDVPPATSASDSAPQQWARPRGLSPRGWAILGGIVFLFWIPLLHLALRGDQPVVVSIPYQDDFSDSSTLAKNYWSTGGHWRIVNGELLSPGVRNNPLWLQGVLPQNVAVEFDVRSESPEGDIKVEIFGDGLNHASGYVLIHGGWNNRLSIIARMDEHGTPLQQLRDKASQKAKELGMNNSGLVETGVFNEGTRMRVEANPFPVQIGRNYHWRIERRGSVLRWFIDGQQFMEFDDPFPLAGSGHDRLGFSSWEAQLFFDNLRIQPL